jgi:hypothetical protein
MHRDRQGDGWVPDVITEANLCSPWWNAESEPWSHAASNNGPEAMVEGVAIRSDSSNLPLLAIRTSVDP